MRCTKTGYMVLLRHLRLTDAWTGWSGPLGITLRESPEGLVLENANWLTWATGRLGAEPSCPEKSSLSFDAPSTNP